MTNDNRRTLRNIGLFTEEETDSSTNILRLNQIKLPASQPRKYFDPDALEQLKESIKIHGILQPLLVRPLNGNYELIAGERRYRAAQELGLTEIPVHIRQLSDNEARQLSLIENLQREDLNPLEETEAILDLLVLRIGGDRPSIISLLNQLSNAQRGLTDNVVRKKDEELITDIFKGLGRFTIESFRVNRLPLLNLPEEIKMALREGKIAYTKAREIAKIKGNEQRNQILTQSIDQKLSLSEIKNLIRELTKTEQAQSEPNQIKQISKQLSKEKLWETNPKKWQKIQSLIDKIEVILNEDV
jgi:ParB family chromosome partitioning protein